MAKANQKTETINTKAVHAVHAVAVALSKIYDTVENTGNVVTQCVTAAMKSYKGDDIPRKDIDAICDEVAEARGWTGASIKVRQSEVRAVLQQYALLEDACDVYRKKSKSLTWHNVVRLARCLKAEKGNITKAVKAALAKTAKRSQPPTNVKEAKKRAAMSIKTVLALPRLPKQLKADLRELAETYGLNV